jgi:multidrug efflux pump
MSFTRHFIDRPVATTLATLAVTLAGGLAYFKLPVSPLPQVDFPTLSVSANLPGASPETMAATVATPLERTLGRIPGVTEMTSSSSLGTTSITLQFDLDRDINGAAGDVQAAINAASGLLPSGMPARPSYRKQNPSDAPIMILTLTSDVFTAGQIYDYASTVLGQKISQIEGISRVSIGGSSLPAVRVSLDLPAVERSGLSLDQIRNTIASNNVSKPKGEIEDGDRRWQVKASDQLHHASDYLPMIIGYQNGAAIRLGDVATVEDSVQDVLNYGTSNGVPSVSLVLFRQPGANILETTEKVRAMLPRLVSSMPAAIDMKILMERTASIRGSLAEVQHSLILSVILVILVVWLFLRRVRAALIPGVAVPVSLIGTFAVMYLFGYSIDNLSLMALTIATGFVVDDAVVVLENITRHIEAGMPAKEAARRGAKEVTSTVISMSLSLIAVFIPILFMGGIIGRLFREFAVVLSASIVVSLVVSLTTTPMMCARLLGREKNERPPGRISRGIEWCFTKLQNAYTHTLDIALNHRWLTLLALVGTVALTCWQYVTIPKGFIPQQDSPQIGGTITADQSISFQLMKQRVSEVAEIIRQDPAVAAVNASTGSGSPRSDSRNSGGVFINLKPTSETGVTALEVVARLRKKTARIPGVLVSLQPNQDIRIGGRSSSAAYQYSLQSSDLTELRVWEAKVKQALIKLPSIVDLNSDFQDKAGLTRVVIDREAASRLGVPIREIDSTLYSAFGQRQISPIYADLNQYQVVMEARRDQSNDPDALANIRLRSSSGELVPLSSLARWESAPAPLTINHQGQFAAVTISFNLAPGASFSDVTTEINQTVEKLGLPNTIQRNFAGTAGAFAASLKSQPWLVLAGLLVIYLTLGILYESFLHPLTILSTLPSAGIGALLALRVCKLDFDIMGFIGIFLLIGIVKKNAIMMIDFALDAERQRGLDPKTAILEACKLRLRPILMTTLAALFGALPLAIGYGYGSELRRPLGVSIVGGLILSQLLTLYTTPVVYLFLDNLRHRWMGNKKLLKVRS